MTDDISLQLLTEQQLISTLLVRPENLYEHDISPDQLEHLGHYLKAIQDTFQRTGSSRPRDVSDTLIAMYPTNDSKELTANIPEFLSVAYIARDAGPMVDWLKNAHRIRRITQTCQEIMQKSMLNGVRADDLYALMSKGVSSVECAGTYQKQGQVIENWIKGQTSLTATPTGFHMLDAALEGGLQDGNVYGLAGYAKAGKTMLAGTISSNMAERGIRHLYVAMEMGAGAIESRAIARRLGITNRSLKNQIKMGRNPVTADMIHNVTHYLNAPGITWSELKQQMTIAVHRDGIKRFIVDYWQLLTNDTRKDDHQYWADAAQGISDFCKRYDAACILVAQLNDDGKTLGSRGLIRACDMLLNIEFCKDQHLQNMRWLSMRATRETEQADLGSETNPYLEIDKNGPYMKELQQ